MARAIQEQVILPWPVAIRITLRGLKIRIGRSLITMSGVVLGIAFLMSVLTGEGLKRGLADETRTKTEVNRLIKLIEDEIGTFKDRRLGIVVGPDTSDNQILRMLNTIAGQVGEGAIEVYEADGGQPTGALAEVLAKPAFQRVSELPDVFTDVNLVLLLTKDFSVTAPEKLLALMKTMRQPVILDTVEKRFSEDDLRARDPHAVYSALTYQMTEEEKQRFAARQHQAQARHIWITVVSILVTVIGISNAMLMSVTERIREIGTMKCLGALSGFVVKLFVIESFLIGVAGAVVGTIMGFIVPFVAYMLSAGVGLLLASTPLGLLALYGAGSVTVGTLLAIVAAIYPAVVAAKMVPADALRTNV